MPGRRKPAAGAAESRPPAVFGRSARVKGCGKSAPRVLATGPARHSRLEQGQIGSRWRGPRRLRVGRKRQSATIALDEWLLATEPGLSTGSRVLFAQTAPRSGTNIVPFNDLCQIHRIHIPHHIARQVRNWVVGLPSGASLGATHLGDALVKPVSERMAVLTDGRYSKSASAATRCHRDKVFPLRGAGFAGSVCRARRGKDGETLPSGLPDGVGGDVVPLKNQAVRAASARRRG